MGNGGALTLTIDQARYRRLEEELRFGLARTSGQEMKNWALAIPTTGRHVLVRRVRNVGSLVKKLGYWLRGNSSEVVQAIREKRSPDCIFPRRKLKSSAGEVALLFQEYSERLSTDPKKEGAKLILAGLAFLGSSGGIDGDGGVPDLDLLGGIGAHRSIFTHSIVAGVIIETVLLSVVSLTSIIHRHLPEEHDPLWDWLQSGSGEMMAAVARGVSLGIAHHLAIDATIDSAGTYKDLPFDMPQEGHVVVTAGNAVAEGYDATVRATGGPDKPKASVARNRARQTLDRARPVEGTTRVKPDQVRPIGLSGPKNDVPATEPVFATFAEASGAAKRLASAKRSSVQVIRCAGGFKIVVTHNSVRR